MIDPKLRGAPSGLDLERGLICSPDFKQLLQRITTPAPRDVAMELNGIPVTVSEFMPSWMAMLGNPFDGGVVMVTWNDDYREHLAQKFRAKGWRAKAETYP